MGDVLDWGLRTGSGIWGGGQGHLAINPSSEVSDQWPKSKDSFAALIVVYLPQIIAAAGVLLIGVAAVLAALR